VWSFVTCADVCADAVNLRGRYEVTDAAETHPERKLLAGLCDRLNIHNSAKTCDTIL
jgi:hypothetical protein